MLAWKRLATSVVVCLIACGYTPSLRADPLVYSTWGTVDLGNEPDHQLQGVSSTPASPDSAGQFSLGSAPINAVDPFAGPAPPSVSNTPFDIHVVFNNNLPSLELKGVFNFGEFVDRTGFHYDDYNGIVTSVVSSNPSLDANLPALFAAAISDPGVLALQMGMWDWSVPALPITLSSQQLYAVPEPNSTLVFGAAAVLGALYVRAGRRRRADG